MISRIVPFLLLVLLTASGCIMTSRPPMAEYVLTNGLPEKIQIEAFDRKDKRLCQTNVKPNHELILGDAVRLVIHKSGDVYEYALPSNLRFRPLPQANRSEPYMLMLGGRWRLSMTESNYLDVACIKEGYLPVVFDHTKPPLGFPLRPRKSDESFEKYNANLEEAYRSALASGGN